MVVQTCSSTAMPQQAYSLCTSNINTKIPHLSSAIPLPHLLSPLPICSLPSPSAAVHVFPLVLGTVQASDVEGDTVTYSLLDNVTIFFVSPAGGQVAALGEVTQTYNLTVVGVDSGTPPLTGSATIQILTAGVVTHVIGTMCVCVCASMHVLNV